MYNNKPFNTDLESACRPLHFVAKLVGIESYTFIRSTQSGEETINISWKYNLSSVIWSVLLLTVGTVCALYKLTQSFTKMSESLSALLTYSLQIPLTYVSGMLPIILGLTTYRTRMLQLVTQLSTVDKCLVKHGDDVYKKHKTKILTLLVWLIAFYIPLCGLFIYTSKKENILSNVILDLANFTWLINDTGAVNVVLFLQERLSILNRNMEYNLTAELRSYKVANTSVNCVVKSRRHRILTAEHLGNISEYVEQRFLSQHQNIQNSVPTGVAMDQHYQSKIEEKIITYRKIYKKLYDISCLINSMYGISLLISSLSHTLHFVSGVYYAIHFLLIPYSNNGGLISKQRVVLFVISSLLTLIRIISITLSCHKACEECQRCMDIVQELLLRSDRKDTVSQLKLFSSQLENNRIEFTACGFFAVNLSLLTAITGVTVTYVILLIQV
jgi:hypothetical protein